MFLSETTPATPRCAWPRNYTSPDLPQGFFLLCNRRPQPAHFRGETLCDFSVSLLFAMCIKAMIARTEKNGGGRIKTQGQRRKMVQVRAASRRTAAPGNRAAVIGSRSLLRTHRVYKRNVAVTRRRFPGTRKKRHQKATRRLNPAGSPRPRSTLWCMKLL